MGGTLSNTVRIASASSTGQLGCWRAGLAKATSSRTRRSSGSGGSAGSLSMGTSVRYLDIISITTDSAELTSRSSGAQAFSVLSHKATAESVTTDIWASECCSLGEIQICWRAILMAQPALVHCVPFVDPVLESRLHAVQPQTHERRA